MLEDSSTIQEPIAKVVQPDVSPFESKVENNSNSTEVKESMRNEEKQQNHSLIKKKKMKYSNQMYFYVEQQEQKQQDLPGNRIANEGNQGKTLDDHDKHAQILPKKEQKANEANKQKQSKLGVKILGRDQKQRRDNSKDKPIGGQDANQQLNRQSSKGRTSNSIDTPKIGEDSIATSNQQNKEQQQKQVNQQKHKGDSNMKDKKKEKKPLNEKERLREAGFYTKINYNLSEIIQNKTLAIKIEAASNAKLQKDIENQVYAKTKSATSNSNKKNQSQNQEQKTKEQDEYQQDKGRDEKEEGLNDKANNRLEEEEYDDGSPKGNVLTKKKKKNNRRAKTRSSKDKENMDKIEEISAGKADNLVKINELETSLNAIKESKNEIAAGWDQEILTEEQLRIRDREIETKEARLRQLKEEMAKSEAAQMKQIEEERIEREQRERKRLEKKKQRLGHLVNISKILIQAKQARGIPHPKLLKVTKYKAVPAGQLDFELIVKKKKKISRIKNALIAYLSRKDKERGLENQEKISKGQQEGGGDELTEDCYETINEEEDEQEEEEAKEEARNHNSLELKQQKQIYKEDAILQSLLQQQGTEVVIYKLPSYIDEQMNLGGVKYNNMILRDWVDHLPNSSIEDMTLELINGLSYSQAMKKLNQPKKAKKRIVAGFKEVLGSLKTTSKERMSKCIIVALNLQQSPLEHGTDQAVLEILTLAETKQIPVIHASTRSKLGKAFTGKFGPRVSVASIINHEGFQEQFSQIQEYVQVAREELRNKLQDIVKAKIIKDESKSNNKNQKKNEDKIGINQVQSVSEKKNDS